MFHFISYFFRNSVLFYCIFMLGIAGSFTVVSTAAEIKPPEPLTNQPLQDYQTQLLDLAFESATAIPVEPHIKDRSRTQEAVIQAWLKLHQPKRAMEKIEQIENWRRGSCYADLAFYCAENGSAKNAEQFIEQAQQSTGSEDEEWRIDHIKVKIAQTYILLGDLQKAKAFASDVVETETGKIEQAAAKTISDASFDEQIQEIDQLIASGTFDVVKNSLNAYVELYDRFMDDGQKRSILVDKIRSSWEPMPVPIRIELLQTLTEKSLQHAHQETALQLILDARQMIGEYKWSLDHYFPMMAKVCLLRYQAGDKEQAQLDSETVLTQYQENREHIINIWRAGALRPIAEACHAMGNTPAALAIYMQAVEEGMENPNSRPRAEDLSATCVSMALHGIEPDEALWKRLYEIQKGMSAPW